MCSLPLLGDALRPRINNELLNVERALVYESEWNSERRVRVATTLQ
jgi:hypothetical protein